MPAETATRPTVKDRLQGRSLQIPGEGDIRVTTLKGSRKKTLVQISDYGEAGDLAFTEVANRIDAIDKKGKIRRQDKQSVDAFATVSTGFVIEQIGLHGATPESTIIFSNTAPRGADSLGGIVWEGQEQQRFVFGVLDTGVPVLAVNTGYNLSFVRERLDGLWVADVPNNGTQFRSRDTYPDALQILQGKKGRKYIGEKLDPLEAIPPAPKVTRDEDGRLEIPVLYRDGYGNLKTVATREDLPQEVVESKELFVSSGKGRLSVVNKLSGAKVTEGDLFLTEGSSGDKKRPYLEVNQMFGRAADMFAIRRVTDNTKLVVSA